MKIYIFADLEGISGISGEAYINGAFAAEGSKLMVAEINSCVDACFFAGATEVIVRDGHGSGVNFAVSELDSRARLVQGGTPGKRFLSIEGADAMILLGYHAMAGTAGAILEHTFSSKTITNMFLNGEKVGECGIDAVIAGEYDVPVIMITGDDKTCMEAEKWLHLHAVKCCVKEGFSCNSGLLLSPVEGRKKVYESTLEALAFLKEKKIKPIKLAPPLTLRWEVVERCMLPVDSRFKIIDGRSYERSGESLEDIFLK